MSKLGRQLESTSELISRPHLTEKASQLAASGLVYTFLVTPTANKAGLKRAIKSLYKVTPRRINLIKLPAKTKVVRGRLGRTTAKRKALVYLKVGDKIEF